jgi:hypothetical protein
MGKERHEDGWLLGCCTMRIALMMEAANTSETLVNFYQTTRRNNPQDSHLHTRLHGTSYLTKKDMSYAWVKWFMHTKIWLENVNRRDHLWDQDVEGRIKIELGEERSVGSDWIRMGRGHDHGLVGSVEERAGNLFIMWTRVNLKSWAKTEAWAPWQRNN